MAGCQRGAAITFTLRRPATYCSYCFVKNKQNNRHLTMPTATKLIDFIAEDAASLSSVYVHFFGGEPLLRPDLRGDDRGVRAAVLWDPTATRGG